MIWAQLFVGIAAVCGLGVIYPKRAPGDGFRPSEKERRLGQILLACTLCAQLLLVAKVQWDAAVVGGLGAVALGGVLVCAATPRGPRLVLAMGLVALILTGVSGTMLAS